MTRKHLLFSVLSLLLAMSFLEVAARTGALICYPVGSRFDSQKALTASMSDSTPFTTVPRISGVIILASTCGA